MDITDSQATQVFKYLDKSTTNQINTNDLIIAMRYLGIIKTKAAFEALINELPDQINLNQFLNLIRLEKENLIGKTELMKAFETFDEKKTGKVDAKEVYHALRVIGEKLSDNDINALMKMVPPDKDGKINYKELVDCLLSSN